MESINKKLSYSKENSNLPIPNSHHLSIPRGKGSSIYELDTLARPDLIYNNIIMRFLLIMWNDEMDVEQNDNMINSSLMQIPDDVLQNEFWNEYLSEKIWKLIKKRLEK